jgi:diguanylate cyclase (GGDEF)-like protein
MHQATERTRTVAATGVAESVEAMFRQLKIGQGAERSEIDVRTWKYDPLWQLAMADPHTGLANQLLLRDRLSQALSRRQRHGGEVVVMHMQLTNLGDIHAELGYTVGNEVICEMSRRLTASLRDEDTVGRVGGSELVAVMAIDGEEAAKVLVRRLQKALDGPVIISGRSVLLSTHVGVAVAQDSESADDVLSRANRAA